MKRFLNGDFFDPPRQEMFVEVDEFYIQSFLENIQKDIDNFNETLGDIQIDTDKIFFGDLSIED
jgi:hypothetical protein